MCVGGGVECVCGCRHSWPHQAMTHMIPSVWCKLDMLRCMHGWAFKIKHLNPARKYNLTLKPAVYLLHAATTKPLFRQTLSSLFLMTSDIFSAIYLQAVMGCSMCGWGGSLGAPAWPLFTWSGPTWRGIWLGPVGPRLGAESWSAASMECQTFEVRLVKKKRKKERRLVGVWSNRPLCLK